MFDSPGSVSSSKLNADGDNPPVVVYGKSVPPLGTVFLIMVMLPVDEILTQGCEP